MLDDSMQKEITSPKHGLDFIFPVADGTVKLSGGDQGIRRSTLIRDQPERGEERRDDLQGDSDGSQPIDTMMDDGEARNDFWSMKGNYIYRHYVEPRVQLYVPKEETFPLPLRYIDVVRTTHTSLSRIDDYWNIDGVRNLWEPSRSSQY